MLGLVGLAALACVACDKMALTAPTETTITLFANVNYLPLGGVAEITASVIEEAGTAVQNGTVVTFTTTLGTIEPREARTNNGKATVRLIAGNVSGVARVQAFSGPANSGDPLEIPVGGAAVGTVLLSAQPASVPATGGTVDLVAIVSDADGNRLNGVPVAFTATAGRLLATTVVSDTNGESRTQLVTSQASTVTATAGAKNATAQIAVVSGPSVSLTFTPAVPLAGDLTTFTVTVTVATGGAAVQSVTLDFGDGRSQSLGNVAGAQTVSHVYASRGTYTATATVVDTSGQRAQAVVVVTLSVGPINVSLSLFGGGQISVGATVSFNATVTPSNIPIQQYEWDFGDGVTRITSGNTVSHAYSSAGVKVVRVTARAVDGRTGVGITEVQVLP